MAKDVTVDLGKFELRREEAGVNFVVHSDGGKRGELRVSKGGIRWWSRNERGEAHYATWSQLDDFMKEKPRR